jgi:hypothetical protein
MGKFDCTFGPGRHKNRLLYENCTYHVSCNKQQQKKFRKMDTCIFGPGEHKTDCYMRIVYSMSSVIYHDKKKFVKTDTYNVLHLKT